MQVIEDRIFKIGKDLVLVPERQLLFAAWQVEFPVAATHCLQVFAVVVVERIVGSALQRFAFEERQQAFSVLHSVLEQVSANDFRQRREDVHWFMLTFETDGS